jgi:Lar family restriction alleviation protein
MTEELKPCPFCGSEVVGLYAGHRIICYRCGAEGPSMDDEAAPNIAGWNRRAIPCLIPLPVIDESLLGEGK